MDGVCLGCRCSRASVRGSYLQLLCEGPTCIGCIEFDTAGNVVSIEEKAGETEVALCSFLASTSMIIELWKWRRILSHPQEARIEITDLNEEYLKMGELRVELFGRGMA